MKEHHLLPKADRVLLADDSDLKITRTFKGLEKFEIVVTGKPVHSSAPGRGVNAIDKMMEVIQALDKTRFTEHEDPDLGKSLLRLRASKVNLVLF